MNRMSDIGKENESKRAYLLREGEAINEKVERTRYAMLGEFSDAIEDDGKGQEQEYIAQVERIFKEINKVNCKAGCPNSHLASERGQKIPTKPSNAAYATSINTLAKPFNMYAKGIMISFK